MDMIQNLKERMQAELAPYQAIQEDRMKRYFDCQDDTILGGISDQVTSETMRRIRLKYDLWIEQHKNGGTLTGESRQLCLLDLNGNLLSDRIVNTKYGNAFIFEVNGEVKFVSVAKKASTYTKKGYAAKERVREFSYTFKGIITDKGRCIFDNIVLKSEKFQDEFESVSMDGWINYLYESNKAKNN